MFWAEFGILCAGSLIGATALIPYLGKMMAPALREGRVKLSQRSLILLSFAQTAVISAIAVGVGLLASHAVGLGAPYIEALIGGSIPAVSFGHAAVIAIVTGAIAGAMLLIGDLFFLPYFPKILLDTALATRPLESLAASFYGGINEELLLRWCGMSVFLWLLTFISQTSAGLPTTVDFWIANVVMTILFGLGHLPALKQMIGGMLRLMVIRSLLLNAPVGLLCGWLFWTYGIEAAMIAHFSVDIVYHVFGTYVLRWKAATV